MKAIYENREFEHRNGGTLHLSEFKSFYVTTFLMVLGPGAWRWQTLWLGKN